MNEDNKSLQNSEINPKSSSFSHILDKNTQSIAPKLVSRIYNQKNYHNRFLYTFNFSTMKIETIKVPENVGCYAKHASFIGENELITICEKNHESMRLFLQRFGQNDYDKWKELPITSKKAYTIYNENYLYAISYLSACKYNEKLKSVHSIPKVEYPIWHSVKCHIMFGRYLNAIFYRKFNYENSKSLIIKRLDILDEEAGWETINETDLDLETNTYKLSMRMSQFSYGFYNFQSLGKPISITFLSLIYYN